MSDKNNRDDVAIKLSIVNKIIRNGYDNVKNSISLKYRDYTLSIRNDNHFLLKEELMNELSPLINSF